MLICEACGLNHPADRFEFQCRTCGGVLRLGPGPAFDPSGVDRKLRGVWRYRHTFPFPSVMPCTLGEGSTPLVEGRVDGHAVYFKLESLNPTGSFKDRGTSVLVSVMASHGIRHVVEDSSGNAGSSLAAYGGRAGMQVTIYCPLSTSPAKLRQIEAHGADLVRIPGPRAAATQAARHAAKAGTVYASHVYNPIGLAGMATVAFEIWEELQGVPDAIVVPVGQGTLLLGLHRGFVSLRQSGLIASLPKLIGVQAERCAPLMAASHAPASDAGLPTLAEGISIPDPARTAEVFAALEESAGTILSVSETSILEGVAALAYQGLYVENTSAVVWAVLRQLVAQSRPASIVGVLTGHGLKMTARGVALGSA